MSDIEMKEAVQPYLADVASMVDLEDLNEKPHLITALTMRIDDLHMDLPSGELWRLCAHLERFTALKHLNLVASRSAERDIHIVLQTVLLCRAVRNCTRLSVITDRQYTIAKHNDANFMSVTALPLPVPDEISWYPPNGFEPSPVRIESILWGICVVGILDWFKWPNLRQLTVVADATVNRPIARQTAFVASSIFRVPYVGVRGRCAPSLLEWLAVSTSCSTGVSSRVLLPHWSSQSFSNEDLIETVLQHKNLSRLEAICWRNDEVVYNTVTDWDTDEHDMVSWTGDGGTYSKSSFTQAIYRRQFMLPVRTLSTAALAVMRANKDVPFLRDSAMQPTIIMQLFDFLYKTPKGADFHIRVPEAVMSKTESYMPPKACYDRVRQVARLKYAHRIVGLHVPVAPRVKIAVRGRKRKELPS